MKSIIANSTVCNNTPNQQVFFTIFTSRSSPLSKRFDLVDGNNIKKTPAALMVFGKSEKTSITFKELPSFFNRLTSHQSTGYGVHDVDQFGTTVSIQTALKANPPKSISRTKQYFSYQSAPGVLMIDHDPYPYVLAVSHSKLIEILASIHPAIADAACFSRGSVSSGVHVLGQDAPTQTSKAFHLYFPVENASDIPRYGLTLFKRLWLTGYGTIALSAVGSMLDRSLIDAAVFSAERLDFTGRPICGEGIGWTPPSIEYHDGGYLDTISLASLTDDEEAEYQRLVAEAKKRMETEAAAKGCEWFDAKISEMVDRGANRTEAGKQIAKFINGNHQDLPPDFLLYFAAVGTATVAEVLSNIKQYDGQALADPIEGPEYGTTTAIFYGNISKGDAKPFVNSFAHGGAKYFLKAEPQVINEEDESIECEVNNAAFKKTLLTNSKGALLKCHFNAVEIINKVFPSMIGYNDFRQRIEKKLLPEWKSDDPKWSDPDTGELTYRISKQYGSFSFDVINNAVMTFAHRNKFNPAIDRLYALAKSWDGKNRGDKWLIDFLGAEYNDSNYKYLCEIGSAWIKGVAARVIYPGCKRDDVLVLCGKQGVGKSTAARVIADAIHTDAFTDSIGDLSSKDARSALRGIVIAELGELSALSKNDIETIKAFVATSSDHFRESYGHHETTYKRTVSFIGTTNNPTFLIDPTGNRRWWPVTIKNQIDIYRFKKEILQILGEAAARVMGGEAWHVTNATALEQADNVRIVHFDEDIWTTEVMNATKELLSFGCNMRGSNTEYVTISLILNFMDVRIEGQNKTAKNRIASVLRQQQFRETRLNRNKTKGERITVFLPPVEKASTGREGMVTNSC